MGDDVSLQQHNDLIAEWEDAGIKVKEAEAALNEAKANKTAVNHRMDRAFAKLLRVTLYDPFENSIPAGLIFDTSENISLIRTKAMECFFQYRFDKGGYDSSCNLPPPKCTHPNEWYAKQPRQQQLHSYHSSPWNMNFHSPSNERDWTVTSKRIMPAAQIVKLIEEEASKSEIQNRILVCKIQEAAAKPYGTAESIKITQTYNTIMRSRDKGASLAEFKKKREIADFEVASDTGIIKATQDATVWLCVAIASVEKGKTMTIECSDVVLNDACAFPLLFNCFAFVQIAHGEAEHMNHHTKSKVILKSSIIE